MKEIRKQKLEKYKTTHLTKIGYMILRKEKKRLSLLKKNGEIEEGKSMMELIEIALIETYNKK